MTAPRGARDVGVGTVAVAVLAVLLLARFLVHAATLAGYPWDWDPSEGQAIDGAMRLLDAPGTYFSTTAAAPTSQPYPPLFSILCLPGVAAFGASLAVARIVACAATVALLVAVVILARRAGPPWLALAAAAVVVVDESRSFWLVLARVDSLLVALLVWATVVAMPRTLARHGDVLDPRRALVGAALLTLAAFAKQTAVLHALPLLAAWLVVDPRSALRLGAALGVAGALSAALLVAVWGDAVVAGQAALAGHPWKAAQVTSNVLRFAKDDGAHLIGALVAAAVLARAAAAGRSAETAEAAERAATRPALAALTAAPSSLVLVAMGLVAVPLIGKHGAMWNYFLLLHVAGVLLFVELMARTLPLRPWLAPAAVTLALGWGALRGPFPLPDDEDRRTGAVIYDLVRERGAPVLATKLDLLYPLVGQPAEIEGDSFVWIGREGHPDIDRVFNRLQRGHYRTVLRRTYLWPVNLDQTLILPRYTEVLRCKVGLWFGDDTYRVFLPRGERFALPEDRGRCVVVPGEAPP